MSKITTYYLRKIDGKIYDSETQEISLSNGTREKHYYSYNNWKEEIIVKELRIITHECPN